MDGLISVERFQSLTDPDKLLSLSFWRDEEAVAGWRSRAGHRVAQSAGRKGVFRDYCLRVAAVVRDYGISERRDQAPADRRAMGLSQWLSRFLAVYSSYQICATLS